MICAYLSALPFSLSMSFYPLLLAQLRLRRGHLRRAARVARPRRHRAPACSRRRFVRTGPQTLWPVVCGVAVAAVGRPRCRSSTMWRRSRFWMLVVGVGSAAMTLYFQITISEASRPEERGSALALGGLGWSVSHLQHAAPHGLPRRPLRHRRRRSTSWALCALACARCSSPGLRRWAFRPALNIPGSSEWRSSRR